MKYIILAATIAARLAMAQSPPPLSSLPPCGQRCITNMLAKAEELGCNDATDVACLCTKQDFTNGVTDCTNESCLNGENKQQIINAGVQICAAALAQISSGSIQVTATPSALVSGISIVSASKTSQVSASQTSQASASKTSEASASKSSQVSASQSSEASATTQPSTVTETVPVSTASILVAPGTDSAGRNITSTIGGLVEGGIAITTTDSRGSTFVTTATALPSNPKPSGVPVTTTNSLGSTIVTTETPRSSGTVTVTTGGAATTTKAATSSTSSGAAVRLAAAGCGGFVGMAAMILL